MPEDARRSWQRCDEDQPRPARDQSGCTGNCWSHAPADEVCDWCREHRLTDITRERRLNSSTPTTGGTMTEPDDQRPSGPTLPDPETGEPFEVSRDDLDLE